MLVLLIAGQVKDLRRPSRAMVLGALAIGVTLPFTRSTWEAKFPRRFWCWSLLTWESPGFRESPGIRKNWIVALLVAAIGGSGTVPVACLVLVAFKYGIPLLRTGKVRPHVRDASPGRELVFVCAATGLSLLAWSFLGYRSCGSFLFPLHKGSYRMEFGLLALGARIARRHLTGTVVAGHRGTERQSVAAVRNRCGIGRPKKTVARLPLVGCSGDGDLRSGAP